jgi:glycosyltransferase involved in cell wall biosynthesis
LRVALDYTPAISQNAGVGRYTRSLFQALRLQADEGTEWTLWYSPDSAQQFPPPDEEYVRSVQLPYRARWTNLAWHRLGLPLKLERFTGSTSVVHGTDFVVPPSRAPSVVTVHDLSYALLPHLAFPRLSKYLNAAVPRSIDRARQVIAVSESTREDICELYEISPNRVRVVHHAADPIFAPPTSSEQFAMKAQFGIRHPYFIIVGTVEPRKDHLTLLRAFSKVQERHPDVALIIVGREGWLASDIMSAINSAAARSNVIHLQGIRDEMLPALYGGSTALVYPSRYEGFGLPLLEAMACHTAVIASDLPVHREVAGDAALYAPAQSPEELAAQMCKVLEDTDERQRLVGLGRIRTTEFSWERAADQHLEIYREIAGE